MYMYTCVTMGGKWGSGWLRKIGGGGGGGGGGGLVGKKKSEKEGGWVSMHKR